MQNEGGQAAGRAVSQARPAFLPGHQPQPEGDRLPGTETKQQGPGPGQRGLLVNPPPPMQVPHPWPGPGVFRCQEVQAHLAAPATLTAGSCSPAPSRTCSGEVGGGVPLAPGYTALGPGTGTLQMARQRAPQRGCLCGQGRWRHQCPWPLLQCRGGQEQLSCPRLKCRASRGAKITATAPAPVSSRGCLLARVAAGRQKEVWPWPGIPRSGNCRA